MGKYCPHVERQVVYLECLECDDKVCKKEANNHKVKLKPNEKEG